MARIGTAIRAFFGILFGGALPEDVAAELGLARRVAVGAAPKAAPAIRPVDGAAQLLSLLQREARLLDFLMEDITPYSEAQVGAAARGVHAQCRQVLARHLQLEPVIDGVEGTRTRLETAGIDPADPALVKFTGNVPPSGHAEAGILRHRGWRIAKADLPPPAGGEKSLIVAPAEIEIE